MDGNGHALRAQRAQARARYQAEISAIGPISSGLAACAGGAATPQMLISLLEHFREQHSLNRVLFEHPVRRLWVKRLAVLIERKVALESRAGRGRPRMPRSLLALTIAEMQIALIVHWLTGAVAVKSEVIAEALVFNTRAMLERPPDKGGERGARQNWP